VRTEHKEPDVTPKRWQGRILIVDDDRDFAFSLVDILESRGYQVEVAHNAESGHTRAKDSDAQVALVDIRLGRESGIDLIAPLQEARPGILCVMMTAYATLDTAIEAIHRGAYDYLQKPLNIQYMLVTLERCFEKLRLEREKAAAEQALENSERLLRTIAENYPSYLSIIEKDLTIGFTSGKELAKHDLDPQSFVGLPLQEVFGEQAPVVRAHYLKAFDGKEVSFELYINNEHQLYNVIPLVDENGEVQRLLAVVENITERKQAEESRKRLVSILEATTDFVSMTDANGHTLYVNRAGRKMMGFGEDEDVSNLNITDYHPQPVAELIMREGIPTAIRDGVWVNETVFLSRDGREIPSLYVLLTHKSAQGEVEYFSTVARDVTERVRMEEALRQRNRELVLLNRAGQELSAMLNLQQVAEQVLQEVTETLGAEGASVWLWDVREPHSDAGPDRDEGWLMCQAALLSERNRSPLNLRLRPGQGIVGWAAQEGESVIVSSTSDDSRFFPGIDEQTGFHTTSLLAVPLWTRHAVIGVLEVVNKRHGEFDANDLALVETLAASAAIAIDNARLVEALRKRTDELQARNQDLDAYAHTVAHDLKGPLGHMVGFARVLEQDHALLSDEELRHYLHTISQSGHKMSNIIDELLLLAGLRKIEDVDVGPLDMARIVAEARGRLVDLIEGREAEIILPESYPVALGYGPWIEEVWVNYLSNAIKYGGERPRVELGADPPFALPGSEATPAQRSTEGQIRFWVRDNGPGLTLEEQGRLFRPFERLDRVRAKGYGLGLSIVRRIVKKLGGQVGVESTVGVGSTFWFTLPASPADT
jgi:PAS domain S-box-containing protein